MRCDKCKHNRSGIEDIKVDGWTVAQYEDWGCAKESEMTQEQLDAACETDGDVCPFYEYDKDLDDPCYACPGSPDYCDRCKNKEQE